MNWKAIKGLEGLYEISDSGTVRSLDRYVNNNGGQRMMLGQDMKISVNPSGYAVVNLSKNGNRKHYFVHKLVAEAFIPNNNDEYDEVNHIDHNKLNNSVENLEWCNRAINVQKRHEFYGTGRTNRNCKKCGANKKSCTGEHCVKCRPRPRKVKNRPSENELLNLLRNNSFIAVGKMFGVSDNAVRKWCKYYGLPVKRSEL